MGTATKGRALVSIIVPVYNEAENIERFHAALTAMIDRLPFDFQVLMVNDGSRDESAAAIEQLSTRDARVQLLDLARNFGKEAATSAGLAHAEGDAAIMIDADLQHPVELLGVFLSHWESGADIVIGVRDGSDHYESWLKKAASRTYYRIFNALSEVKMPPHATDYRLLDRSVIDAFNKFTERNRITRGLVDWLGFERDYVYFQAAQRQGGRAAYSLRKLVALAQASIIANSFVPLKLAGYLGALIVAVSGPIGLFVYFSKYVFHTEWGMSVTGSATLGVLILFLVGIMMVCLGTMAMYIASIYREVMNRPLYVVRHGRRPRRRAGRAALAQRFGAEGDVVEAAALVSRGDSEGAGRA